MNKEITIYELLGLIKDGKEPKKIKYNGDIYEYKILIEGSGYVHEQFIHRYIWLSNEIANKIDDINFNCLNDKVEILKEDEDIEELKIENDSNTYFYIRNEHGTKCSMTKHSKVIAEKLNEVIREVNKLRKENK